MSGRANFIYLARNPVTKQNKKHPIAILVYFGFLLVLGKLLFCFGKHMHDKCLSRSYDMVLNHSSLIPIDLENVKVDLIQADWEPLKSHNFLSCDSLQWAIEEQEKNSSEWFPFIDKVKTDNFVIISNTNCGYLDFALNFWEHYRRLGYSNIVFIAEDCISYNILVSRVGKHHVAPPILKRGRTHEDEIFSDIFRNMTLLRPKYLHYFLNRGVSVMWQDIDSVPIRNTIDFFPRGYDIVAVDDYSTDAHYRSNYLCACLLLLSPTQHTFTLLKDWMSEIDSNLINKNDNDQLALNRALAKLRNRKQISLAVLPRTVYPNGHDYDSFTSTAAWIHANYLIGGKSKREYLRTRGYWLSSEYEFDCET